MNLEQGVNAPASTQPWSQSDNISNLQVADKPTTDAAFSLPSADIMPCFDETGDASQIDQFLNWRPQDSFDPFYTLDSTNYLDLAMLLDLDPLGMSAPSATS